MEKTQQLIARKPIPPATEKGEPLKPLKQSCHQIVEFSGTEKTGTCGSQQHHHRKDHWTLYRARWSRRTGRRFTWTAQIYNRMEEIWPDAQHFEITEQYVTLQSVRSLVIRQTSCPHSCSCPHLSSFLEWFDPAVRESHFWSHAWSECIVAILGSMCKVLRLLNTPITS